MPVTREAEYLPYVYTCNRCRSCTVTSTLPLIPVCPAHAWRPFFAYSGGGKAYSAQGVIEKRIPVDERLAEIAFTCQLCGACMALCPPQFDTVSMIRDLRDHVVGAGKLLSEGHRQLVANLRATGNPWGERAEDSAGEPVPAAAAAPQDGRPLLFAGCSMRWSPGGRRMLGMIRTLLDRAGIEHTFLGAGEPPCGCFELNLGLKRAFPRIAEKTIGRLNGLAPSKIIAAGPSCQGVFAKDYMDAGDLEPETTHATAVILEALSDGRLRPAASAEPVRVTYHDPCSLGRGSGVFEPPREILRRLPGVDLVEMRRARAEALCCGSGPGMREINPDFAAFTARERAREIVASGAQAVVTACPACVESLRSALDEAGSPIEVLDLYGFVLERTTVGG